MGSKLAGAGLALALGLGACSTQPTNELGTLYGAYMTAVSAEIAYEKLPSADPAVVKEVEVQRKQAWADLQALQGAVDAGGTQALAGSAVYLAAEGAIAGLQSYEAAHGVGAKAPGGK